jgi:hypothetical protein
MNDFLSINVVASSTTACDHWKCLINACVNANVKTWQLYDFSSLSREFLEAALLVTEVWHPLDPTDPAGFRLSQTLADRTRSLMFFSRRPGKGFPDEGPYDGKQGPFWITFNYIGSLKDKIFDVIEKPPAKRVHYEALVKAYPSLGRQPVATHH